MGHAIVCFDMTGQLLQESQIEFSCYWNTRWIENETKTPDHDVLDKNGNILPTGQALAIWGNFLGKQIVKTSSSNPFVAYSSYTPDKRKLFVYIINKSEVGQTVSIHVDGYKVSSIEQIWEYFGKNPWDKLPVWQQNETNKTVKKVQLKGTSITVFELTVSK